MSARFLLDTNALSEPLRPKPHAGFLGKLRAHQGEVAISAVTWHEALFGARRLPASSRRRTVESYLLGVVAPQIPILPYDAAAAAWHATERARLAAIRKTPPFADGQIAAIAKVRGLTLVTANTSDFALFEGLEIESWLS